MKYFSPLKAAIRKAWRGEYRKVMEQEGRPLPDDFREQEPGDGDLHPPEPSRVAARAGCLAAVAVRGLASGWSHDEQRDFVPRLIRWFAESGLEHEIEEQEREIIQAPPSELDQQSAINAIWRWEGAAVLAASLGRLDLPSHDVTVDTEICGKGCGLLASPDEIARLIQTAQFDQAFNRIAYSNRALAISWRLRQFANIQRTPLDFARFAAGVEWAEFNLEGVELCAGDLAIHGQPISSADPDHVHLAMSIASERHIAANWLIGWDPVYSAVECPT